MSDVAKQDLTPDRGFIMVALLISMAVAAIWMGALLPAWRQQAIRQKEDDLAFRGEQYARAVALYFTKNRAFPPSVDVLVSQKYLRKKWKDPITNEDFVLIPAPTQGGQQGAPVGRSGAPGAPQGSQLTSGFMGVASKSAASSIRVYQGQQVYSQWPFTYQTACAQMRSCNVGQQPGPGGPGRSVGGGDPAGGGRPGQPGVNPPRGGAPPPPPGRGGTVPPPGRGRGQ